MNCCHRMVNLPHSVFEETIGLCASLSCLPFFCKVDSFSSTVRAAVRPRRAEDLSLGVDLLENVLTVSAAVHM